MFSPSCSYLISANHIHLNFVGSMEEAGMFVWKQLDFQEQRASHQLVYYKDSLFVLFGNTVDSKYFNNYATTMTKFSFTDNKITKKNTIQTFMFSKHCHYKNMIFLFGGRSIQGQVESTFCLNLDTLEIQQLKTNEKEPHERLYHCSTIQDDKFYIFGGETDRDEHLNDIHSFDLNTFQWKEIIPTTDDKPTPRRYASMVSKDRIIYLFGGRHDPCRMNDFWTFDLGSENWNSEKTFGDLPKPMTAFSSVVQGNSIFYFGGNNGSTLDSLYEFYIPTKTWKFIDVVGMTPVPRYWHCAVVHNNEMIIHGGYSEETQNLRDCWKIQLPKRNSNLMVDVDKCRELNIFIDVVVVWPIKKYSKYSSEL